MNVKNKDFVVFAQQLVFSNKHKICSGRESVVYAENVHGGVSFSGIWWSFVSGVRSSWRHNLTSYSCFQANVLAKFV